MSFQKQNNSLIQQEKLLKIISIGPPNAGKTSLLRRLSNDSFQEQYLATIGSDFAMKRIVVDNQIVKLQMWDTAGQERYRTAVCKAYYRGAHGMFLTFDISDENSFGEMQKFYEQTLAEIKNMNTNIPTLLVGCKCDLEQKRIISYDVAFAFAQSQGMHYIETSAKMSINCLEAADYLARQSLLVLKDQEQQALQVELQQQQPQQKKTSCC